MELWREELYHRDHKYVAKFGKGKDARYFYSQADYQAFLNAKKKLEKANKEAFYEGNTLWETAGFVDDTRHNSMDRNGERSDAESYDRYQQSIANQAATRRNKAKQEYDELAEKLRSNVKRTSRKLTKNQIKRKKIVSKAARERARRTLDRSRLTKVKDVTR